MILDKMTTQLRTNFQSDPLEEMCKLLQKNLIKYVMNLCRNKENKMTLKKFIVALLVGQVRDYLLTLSISQTAILVATSTLRDY